MYLIHRYKFYLHTIDDKLWKSSNKERYWNPQIKENKGRWNGNNERKKKMKKNCMWIHIFLVINFDFDYLCI